MLNIKKFYYWLSEKTLYFGKYSLKLSSFLDTKFWYYTFKPLHYDHYWGFLRIWIVVIGWEKMTNKNIKKEIKPDYTNAETLTMNHPSCTKHFGCEIPNCNCMCHYVGKDII